MLAKACGVLFLVTGALCILTEIIGTGCFNGIMFVSGLLSALLGVISSSEKMKKHQAGSLAFLPGAFRRPCLLRLRHRAAYSFRHSRAQIWLHIPITGPGPTQ